jgi:hypothetical protein
MGWTWRYLGEAGETTDAGAGVDGAGAEFPTQSDAESWLGENWRELAAAGVDAVVLHDAGREVYGPMSLKPPE